MAAKNIKIPYAERSGELVHISTFDKGGLKPDCLCLVCKKPLVARVGKVRVPHFAHPPDVQPCNPETVLHQLGKRFLVARIEKALQEQQPFKISWRCEECGEFKHTRNVLKGIRSCALERQFGSVRPDVALLTEHDEAAAVFEIIVSHAPEPEALAFYKGKNIRVWQIVLETVEDAERLAQPGVALSVTSADDYCPLPLLPACPDPACRAHGEKMTFRYLRVVRVPCWDCQQPMKAAFVKHGWRGLYSKLGPESFLEVELSLARNEGVVFSERRSHREDRRIVANTCGNCRSHIGTSFYRQYERQLGLTKALTRSGYGCESCGTSHPFGSLLPSPPVPSCSQCADPLTARYFFIFEWKDPDGFHSQLPVVMFGRYRGETVGPLDFTQEELTAAVVRGANERGDQIDLFYRTAGEIIRQRNPYPMLASWWCQRCQRVDQAAGRPPMQETGHRGK